MRSCDELCSDSPCLGPGSPRGRRAGERPCPGDGGEGWEAGRAVATGASAGLVVAPGRPPGLPLGLGGAVRGVAVNPGRAPGLGLPRSNGEGETPVAPSPGIAVAPGRARPPALPFPRSTGDGETPNEGSAVAPGSRRPRLPRGPGEAAGPPATPAGFVPAAGPGLPASRAAARVGGGMFFGFSLLILCSNSARFETPFQPCSILGCGNFRLYRRRLHCRRRLGELRRRGNQELVALHLGECP